MRVALRSLVVVVLCATSLLCIAQERLRPATRQELWASFAVQGGAPNFLTDMIGNVRADRLRFGAELGYRSADVFFAGKQVYLDMSARYKFSDLLSVGVEHRIASRATGSIQQRSIVQAMLRKEFGRFNADYRFIYQHSCIEWGDQREVFRNRFDLGYNIKGWKLDPEFGVEFFSWLSNKGLSYFGTRYHFGTQVSLGKGHSLGLNLIHDRERDVAYPTHRWIWSAGYSLNLRKT